MVRTRTLVLKAKSALSFILLAVLFFTFLQADVQGTCDDNSTGVDPSGDYIEITLPTSNWKANINGNPTPILAKAIDAVPPNGSIAYSSYYNTMYVQGYTAGDVVVKIEDSLWSNAIDARYNIIFDNRKELLRQLC